MRASFRVEDRRRGGEEKHGDGGRGHQGQKLTTTTSKNTPVRPGQECL
jgi:hypothetical protein